MEIVDCEHGTEAWHRIKLGVVSASNAGCILTSTGKVSSQVSRYMHQLLAETLLRAKPESFRSEWMQRGNEMEGEARTTYEFITDVEAKQVGFIFKDERKLVGCSPDALMPGRGLEIKCPAAHTHIEYLLRNQVPSDYYPQVQTSMYITGYETWDFMSYYPGLKPLLITVERDNGWIRKFEVALAQFLNEMQEKLGQLQEQSA